MARGLFRSYPYLSSSHSECTETSKSSWSSSGMTMTTRLYIDEQVSRSSRPNLPHDIFLHSLNNEGRLSPLYPCKIVICTFPSLCGVLMYHLMNSECHPHRVRSMTWSASTTGTRGACSPVFIVRGQLLRPRMRMRSIAMLKPFVVENVA